MKKIIILIVFIIISKTAFSQKEYNSYIEVIGVTTYKRAVKKYMATIILSKDVLYNDADSEEYASLKENFLTKVKASHINISNLREDEFQYLTTGYKKEGTVFVFETTSKEEFIKFLRLRALGAQVYTKNVIYKQNNIEFLSKESLENARYNAEKIVKSSNKKVGKIIAITDTNTTSIKDAIYDDSINSLIQYRIGVRFELLD